MPSKESKGDNILTFADKQFKQTLGSHKYVLETYKSTIENIIKLEGDTPIFLDTSVILSIYEISFIAREKIKQFLTTHNKKIVLTGQVQFEFIKNREKVINSFQEDVTEQLPKDLNSNVISKLTSFINSNKVKLEDYPDIQEKLGLLQTNLSDLLKEVQEKVNDKKGTAKSFLYEDEFLNILNSVILLDNLDENYLKKIKEEYKVLLPMYKSSNTEQYSLNAFPGCAEKGDKDDPTGDYVIYHEIMQYAFDKKTDVIFLSNDTTKGDWMRKDGNPHIHYIENFYLNTGQIIYIINAERLLEKLFETSFESLINEKETAAIIEKGELKLFLDGYMPFKNQKSGLVEDSLLTELYDNGVYSIRTLESKLKDSGAAMPEILAYFPNMNKVGALYICLEILDSNYVRYKRFGEDNEKKIMALKTNWNTKFVNKSVLPEGSN